MPAIRGKRYTAQQRREILDLFARSGLSASRFCALRALSYPTLKRWLGSAASKSTKFVELESSESSGRRLSVAVGNGLWLDFSMDADKAVVASWIRELKAC